MYMCNNRILILIAGLRYRVGGDSLHYIDTYTSMPTWKIGNSLVLMKDMVHYGIYFVRYLKR